MQAITIHNPILPGFNPDPNILKVDETYYIAVSSFEWLPGIRVYASKELVNWQHCTDILTTQVDLSGNGEGGSIWAPQLSYADGLFYCIYTDVKNAQGPFKDCNNYLITAPEITGPWSQPVYVNSSGFDPSLFHDDDGRKWFVNELWDHRMTTSNKSCGIVLQEYSTARKALIGPRYKIFDGTALAKTEAPQLYKHHGCYYLMTAEGGTGHDHSVTVCRAETITGPYTVMPGDSLLTARDKPESPLQCSGHASLVEGVGEHWYIAYLCTRPIGGQHILGRETALQEVRWTQDGWLETVDPGNGPTLTPVVYTQHPVTQVQHLDFHDDFKAHTLDPQWNVLRKYPADWLDLSGDHLQIKGGQSPTSAFSHHLLAIRQNAFDFTAECRLRFKPETFNQLAGLMLFLDQQRYLYLHLTATEDVATPVAQLSRYQGGQDYWLSDTVAVSAEQIGLRFVVQGLSCQAFIQDGDQAWQTLGPIQDLGFLSGGFTGNFVGIAAHDIDLYNGITADFYRFDYTV
ncbi:glycoside hydrolase family 43 protein [Lacticaseibacillus jixiensis]|uniref:glycoside hydrolase family 43 protein n=1 Tax=Lacticaseibacillus jixiensis TaxID=3231926 RepID=UPI0036F2353E